MLEDVLLGFIYQIITIVIAISIYSIYSPLYQRVTIIIVTSGLAHFMACYFYSLTPSDSEFTYFSQASPFFQGSGTGFIINLTWYVREYVTGNSYMSTLYFFSSIAFLGGFFWYLLYLQLADSINVIDKSRIFPAIILTCWPSTVFFSAGIGKDSLCYTFIPLCFILWNKIVIYKTYRLHIFISLACCLWLILMIRPYLAMIFILAYFLYSLRGFSKRMIFNVLFLSILFPVVFLVFRSVVSDQLGVNHFDLESISARAIKQQDLQMIGTSFQMASHYKETALLFLPYSFLMNLFMPIFILARNWLGILASIENLFLGFLFYRFLLNIRIFNDLKAKLRQLKFCFYFFIFGMSFMSLINTNLGLSMRQKSMYVPAFLVVAMLVESYKKKKPVVI